MTIVRGQGRKVLLMVGVVEGGDGIRSQIRSLPFHRQLLRRRRGGIGVSEG